VAVGKGIRVGVKASGGADVMVVVTVDVG